MTLATILGTIGAILFVACAIPLVESTIRLGHCRGVDWRFLALWFLGEAVMLAHVLLLPTLSWPLLANYAVSLVLTGIVCWYRWRPRVRTLEEMVREIADD